MESISVRLEVDVSPSDRGRLSTGSQWSGEGTYDGFHVDVLPVRGHGFGLTEVVDVVVVFGGPLVAGVTANLVTDVVKMAVKGTVRRALARRTTQAIPIAEEDEQFEVHAGSVEDTVGEVLREEHETSA